MKSVYPQIAFFTIISLGVLGCSGQVATHEEAVEAIKGNVAVERLAEKDWATDTSHGLVDDGWLTSFNDPQLITMVNEALENNFSLKVSAAQVLRAESLSRQAGAALKPTIGLAGGYSDRNTEALDEIYGGGLKISWEADVWGRIRSGVAGETETAAASRSDYEFARQSLAATTAKGWFLSITSKILNDEANEIVAIMQETARIVEVKHTVGQGTMQDVHLIKAELAAAQEAARKTSAAQENAKRSLELLLGRYPAAEIATADRLVAVPPPVTTGIPAELLERRPDLISAEQRVAAAFYKQKEAELLHLPRFDFSVGVGAFNLTDAAGNLAAGVFAPLYTGGAIEAEVDKATAEQTQVIAQYAQKALQAFKEVETSLAAEMHLEKRESFLKTVVEENYSAYKLLEVQHTVGKIDLLDVLTVQNKWTQARIALVDVSSQRLLNRVSLHLALGGSFEEN